MLLSSVGWCCLPPPPLGGGATFHLFWWVVLLGFLVLLCSSLLLGGVAFLLLLLVVVLSSSPRPFGFSFDIFWEPASPRGGTPLKGRRRDRRSTEMNGRAVRTRLMCDCLEVYGCLVSLSTIIVWEFGNLSTKVFGAQFTCVCPTKKCRGLKQLGIVWGRKKRLVVSRATRNATFSSASIRTSMLCCQAART